MPASGGPDGTLDVRGRGEARGAEGGKGEEEGKGKKEESVELAMSRPNASASAQVQTEQAFSQAKRAAWQPLLYKSKVQWDARSTSWHPHRKHHNTKR